MREQRSAARIAAVRLGRHTFFLRVAVDVAVCYRSTEFGVGGWGGGVGKKKGSEENDDDSGDGREHANEIHGSAKLFVR